MEIEVYGRNFYRVTSGGSVYFVDMEAFSGKGQCDCADFRCIREPRIHTLGHSACKHIRAVQEALGAILK